MRRGKDQDPAARGQGRWSGPRDADGFWGRFFGAKHKLAPSPRFRVPGLAAYYWDGSAPRPHLVVNISETGAFLASPASWSSGTVLELTLQTNSESGSASAPPLAWITAAQIVRSTPEGCAVRFLHQDRERLQRFREFLKSLSGKELQR
ncbi:MAG: PilZ domain-containing protein [Bryobacteraceae bacterium]|nr:PilZ domain-containing protein [Bryobacteraceae bacterium]